MTSLQPLGFERFANFFLASTLLVLLFPVLLTVALLVLVFDGRPVFFTQRRIGFQGKTFALNKFRTMKVQGNPDCPETVNEVTALGKHLRILSVDELPQLWNVVKGDMNFVGPRPLLEEYRNRYSDEQFRRHEVRPGLTGLAQIRGRNSLSWEEKFRLDVEYVNTRSVAGDLAILMWTVPAVFFARNIGSSDATWAEPFRGQSRQE